jgi:2-dehydro-3-deoxyphosphogluconate aldolase/(4S)-4-hydroxy-2-oxoglutarate aldolase
MVGAAPSVARSRPAIPEQIRSGRIIAIGRRFEASRVLDVGEALAQGGVRAFEVTLDSPGAYESIAALAERFSDEELLVGAGTVMDRDSAERALEAGAKFLVMPHTDPDLVSWAAEQGVPAFPGALSPTEIVRAWAAGAAAVKLFPASAVGPAFVRELSGPLPHIPLVPTGGVTVETAPAFIAAGAIAVGLGRWLTGDGDAAAIRARAAEAVAALSALTR